MLSHNQCCHIINVSINVYCAPPYPHPCPYLCNEYSSSWCISAQGILLPPIPPPYVYSYLCDECSSSWCKANFCQKARQTFARKSNFAISNAISNANFQCNCQYKFPMQISNAIANINFQCNFLCKPMQFPLHTCLQNKYTGAARQRRGRSFASSRPARSIGAVLPSTAQCSPIQATPCPAPGRPCSVPNRPCPMLPGDVQCYPVLP